MEKSIKDRSLLWWHKLNKKAKTETCKKEYPLIGEEFSLLNSKHIERLYLLEIESSHRTLLNAAKIVSDGVSNASNYNDFEKCRNAVIAAEKLIG